MPGREGEAAAHLGTRALESVSVGVEVAEFIARLERRHAVARLAAQGRRIVERTGRSGHRTIEFAGAITARCRMRRDIRRALAAPRDDLDHAADGVRAVEAGTRSAQDFNAFDLR